MHRKRKKPQNWVTSWSFFEVKHLKAKLLERYCCEFTWFGTNSQRNHRFDLGVCVANLHGLGPIHNGMNRTEPISKVANLHGLGPIHNGYAMLRMVLLVANLHGLGPIHNIVARPACICAVANLHGLGPIHNTIRNACRNR